MAELSKDYAAKRDQLKRPSGAVKDGLVRVVNCCNIYTLLLEFSLSFESVCSAKIIISVLDVPHCLIERCIKVCSDGGGGRVR